MSSMKQQTISFTVGRMAGPFHHYICGTKVEKQSSVEVFNVENDTNIIVKSDFF